MSVLTIFAGVNGAGKSTLYRYEIIKDSGDLGIRICPDEILVKNGGDWRNKLDVIRSGVETVKKIEECLENRRSFNWEMTLIGLYAMKYIQKAKDLGYTVRINFVGTKNVETNLKRIKERVNKGGHGIDESLVRMRFDNQFKNLNQVAKLVDGMLFYDNEENMKLVGICADKKLVYYDAQTQWINKLFFPPYLPKEISKDKAIKKSSN